MADFEDVVKAIKESEERVDEVLKAAMLERHEKQPMSMERLQMILNYFIGALTMVLGFTLMLAFFYFISNGGK